MTDNKIIIGALDELSENAHNYIDHKNAEIQALTIRNATLEATIERLENENVLLQGDIYTLQAENEELEEENLILSQKRANIFEITNAFENGRNRGIEELAEKLKEKFSHLEYTIQTNRKTMPVERVKAEVDAVLQNGCANVIDKVLTEMKKEMVGESDV